MLDQAKEYLRRVMTVLRDEIKAGTPIVCLEPSCASVFCDELKNLFPNDETAARLAKQVVLFPEFLDSVGYKPAKFGKGMDGSKALVHGHCHHKALWSMSPEERLLKETGLAPEVLDSGCCGLAGSFGYEAEHYDISMQIGEHKLLPIVRSAELDTPIVVDGFSCRQQIAHGTSRRGMHTAEVLQMALHSAEHKPSKRRPIEAGNVEPSASYPIWTALAGVGAVSAGLVYLLARRSREAGSSSPAAPKSHG
jgi:Fe-S oxidoreductase